jgi:adenine deaminase
MLPWARKSRIWLIVNASLLNVYTGELLDHYSVTIKGEWTAYVGDDPEDTIGPQTKIIDAKGKTIIPGLIDGHTHLVGFCDVSEFLKYSMVGGITTILTETMESFPIMGYEGVIDFLASVRAIDQVNDLVTKELIISLPVIGGEIRSDASRDIAKVAAIDRCSYSLFENL